MKGERKIRKKLKAIFGNAEIRRNKGDGYIRIKDIEFVDDELFVLCKFCNSNNLWFFVANEKDDKTTIVILDTFREV